MQRPRGSRLRPAAVLLLGPVVVLVALALLLDDPARPSLGATVFPAPSVTTVAGDDGPVAGAASEGVAAVARAVVDVGADGCQVALVGDSLVAWATDLHEDAVEEVGCASLVDGRSGRILGQGWQCPADTCWASGLEVLEQWRDAGTLGDLVVVALGTNDAVGRTAEQWRDNWEQAIELTAPRTVVFVSTASRPGGAREARFVAYNEALAAWCDGEPSCVLADWARTPVAGERSSYTDEVHLGLTATEARAAFLASVVDGLVETDGRPPEPFPRPARVVTPPLPSAVAPTDTIAVVPVDGGPLDPSSSSTTTMVAPTDGSAAPTSSTAPPGSTTTTTVPPGTTTTTSTTPPSSTSTTTAAPPPSSTTTTAPAPTTPPG